MELKVSVNEDKQALNVEEMMYAQQAERAQLMVSSLREALKLESYPLSYDELEHLYLALPPRYRSPVAVEAFTSYAHQHSSAEKGEWNK